MTKSCVAPVFLSKKYHYFCTKLLQNERYCGIITLRVRSNGVKISRWMNKREKIFAKTTVDEGVHLESFDKTNERMSPRKGS